MTEINEPFFEAFAEKASTKPTRVLERYQERLYRQYLTYDAALDPKQSDEILLKGSLVEAILAKR